MSFQQYNFFSTRAGLIIVASLLFISVMSILYIFNIISGEIFMVLLFLGISTLALGAGAFVVRKIKEETAQEKAKLARIRSEIEAFKVIDREATIGLRRLDNINRRITTEEEKWDNSLLELKAIHGENIPELKRKELVRTFFTGVFKDEDPTFYTGGPKPIKQPENPNHDLLVQKVKEGLITEKELEEVSCPISKQVMQDPVMGEDKRIYDRFCLENIYLNPPGFYPFDRREMNKNPKDLPQDKEIYDKVQELLGRVSMPREGFTAPLLA